MHLVVRRIHDELRRAGVVIDEEHTLPGETAVNGLVDAALAAASPEAAERRDIDHFVIDGIDDHAGDQLRCRQAHVLKGLAAVGGLVDPVAPRLALTVVVLTRADPHRIRIVGRNGDVANRNGIIQIVEERLPCRPVVRGFPQPASRGCDVEDGGIRLEHCHVVDAPAHCGRSDVAEGQPGKRIRAA